MRAMTMHAMKGLGSRFGQRSHSDPRAGRLHGLHGVSHRRGISTAVLASSSSSPTTLTITRPDDWHLHVRDGAAMRSVVPHTARHYGRAVIMPNLTPPVTTVQMVRGEGGEREMCGWSLRIIARPVTTVQMLRGRDMFGGLRG